MILIQLKKSLIYIFIFGFLKDNVGFCQYLIQKNFSLCSYKEKNVNGFMGL